jgi:S1-C subfamily serine protease
VFLPGQFVLQVARELMANNGQILHGWLGIKGSNNRTGKPKGALVTAVEPAGAAKDHLKAGDVIEAVDGRRVRSMADLRSRLYLLAPGAWVDLRIQRHATTVTVGLVLSTTS